MEVIKRTRLENKTGIHNKFYEILVVEKSDGRFAVVALWGRIGNEPQGQEKGSYGFQVTAETAARRLEGQKINKKGYHRVQPQPTS